MIVPVDIEDVLAVVVVEVLVVLVTSAETTAEAEDAVVGDSVGDFRFFPSLLTC